MILLYLSMERLTIQIPEKKSKLIKSLLKELGVIVETDTYRLAKKLDATMPDDDKPSMEEIVEEIRIVRSGKS